MSRVVIRVAAGLFAAVVLGNFAVAQQIQEVTVQASRVVEQKQVGRTASGVPIVDMSLAYGVSYADLDLTSHAGVVQLEKRVNDAAQQACKELSRQFPLVTTPNDADCAKMAADKAMPKVHELAAAAAKSGGK